mgnify:CR=1 FL=1
MTDGLAPHRLDRAELISLLEALGSENDEEVLAAARVLDTKVSAAGTSWSVLLSPSIGAPEAGTADPGEALAEEAPAAEPLPGDAAAKNAQSLALIEKLLARGGQSEDLRQELEGYKADIAAGEFTDADHNYLRALHKRLSG